MLHAPRKIGLDALKLLEAAALVIISIATVVAIMQEVALMIAQREVRLADLLLLFIYLEVLTMVSMYLKSGQLPVRLPIYIAIVALARYLILDMKAMDFWQLLGVTLGVLLLAVSVLVIRFGHVRFPYESPFADVAPTDHPPAAPARDGDRTAS
ncbi:MAG: phosphate-starvation-inducible PsiE family protein [Chromatiales bacterium]|jgi:protein PsiE|nr:phosphate-starvation-inducible PsiE family protein [Chromatiales bacterium]MDX9766190.1 phosphate-starvation-inducible PsiE family protein [Ectothiorhodospiraceae bacterium]